MKQNKIIVCVCSDDSERRRMVQKVAVKLGLALTITDAGKLVQPTPHDYDLPEAYVVLAGTYNLASSQTTTHQLYRMAINGLPIVIGAKKVQREYEFMCETYFQGDV